jgi:hypothetical protein
MSQAQTVSCCAGVGSDPLTLEGQAQPHSQDSDGGIATPLSLQDAAHKRSDSGNSAASNTGEFSGGSGSTYAFASTAAAAGAASMKSDSGMTRSSSRETDYGRRSNGVSLPVIMEHVSHSERNSETNSSMGDGSRMDGGSTAGIQPAVPVRNRARDSIGEHLPAESSQLEPASSSLRSLPGTSYAASSAAVVGAAAAAVAAAPVATASTPEHVEHESDEPRAASTSGTSWYESVNRPESSMMSEAGQPVQQAASIHTSTQPSSQGASGAGGGAASATGASTTDKPPCHNNANELPCHLTFHLTCRQPLSFTCHDYHHSIPCDKPNCYVTCRT